MNQQELDVIKKVELIDCYEKVCLTILESEEIDYDEFFSLVASTDFNCGQEGLSSLVVKGLKYALDEDNLNWTMFTKEEETGK